MLRMRSISKTTQLRAARAERRAEKRARTLFKTSDSFQNFALKLGMGTDNPLSESTYGFNPITRVRTLLEWIHRGSWLGGIAVDIVANDMTRAGVDIISPMEPDDQEMLEDMVNGLGIWNSICDVIKWSRLYGGALGVYMIDGQDFTQPLRIETVGPGQFKGILPLDRWMVEPSLQDLVGQMGSDFGMPRFYDTGAAQAGVPRLKIHYSRVFRLEGIRLPHWQRVMEMLWGASIYERLYDRMVAFDSATAGAAQLVYKSYLRTYKVKNLRQIAAQGGEALDGLARYVDMMRRFQSIEGVTLMDLEDEFEAVQHSGYAGIADALIQFGQQLSGALQIPLIRLFGQSPTGLNSTGESDLRTYYDGIRQQQESTLRVPIEVIYRCLAQSAGIQIPDSFSLQFSPLWQMRDEDKVQAGNQVTTAVTSAVDSGLVHPATGLKELRQSARLTGLWSNITDDEITEAESMPTPQEQAEHQQQVEMEAAKNQGTHFEGGEHTHGSEFHGGSHEVQEGEHFHEAPKVPPGGAGPPGAGAGPPGVGGPKKPNLKAIAGGKRGAGDSAMPPTQAAGFDIVVEHPKGTRRAGQAMPAHYGYLRGTCSTEGENENMDCFVGPNQRSDTVYVIKKNNDDGSFDEHKVMLAYGDMHSALDHYAQVYGAGSIRSVEPMSSDAFHTFLAGWRKPTVAAE